VALGITTTTIVTVSLRVSDGDGGVTIDTTDVTVLSEGTLLIDGVLHIVGSGANDIVAITKQSSKIKVVATFNDDNPLLFNIPSVSEIQVRVRGGHDIVVVANSVTVPTTIDGGSGNDVLTAGGGDTVIYGGTGNDILAGGPGDNVLIGGDGSDVIVGGAGRDLIVGGDDSDILSGGGGDDILIGGWTIYDNNTSSNRAAIDAIMAVWTSSASFNARVNTLTGSGGLLKANEAVFDDDDCDLLVGGGGRDLLFADTNLWDGAIDLVAYNWLQDALVAVN
jgi:Ca2+-binding RTX toxin-like protein